MTAVPDFEPTLSPEDVAGLTGLHYQSVLAEIRAGALRAKKIRGHYLVTRTAYERWLDPGETPAAQRAGKSPVSSSPRPSPTRSATGSVARLKALEGGGG